MESRCCLMHRLKKAVRASLVLLSLLKQGGIVLSDNLGFHGMVEGKTVPKSRGTRNLVRKIRGYIDYLEHNAAFETEFYDVGDRAAVSKKR